MKVFYIVKLQQFIQINLSMSQTKNITYKPLSHVT